MSFWYLFCQFGCRGGGFFVNFGVILVSLGVFWGPRASQGTPQRGRVEKVMKKLVRGSSPGGSKFQQNRTKIAKKSLRGARWKVPVARCCTRGTSGPPPTMKMSVSSTRNDHFHSSTWRPKAIENGVQWVPFGTPLGGFFVVRGNFSGDRKSFKNRCRNRVSGPCGSCRPGGPPALRTSTPTLQKAGTWIGGTPLRAARARWRIYIYIHTQDSLC